MSNKPLSDDFKDRLLNFYRSIDCKYLVFKIEDLINSINEDDYLFLINMMDKYNQYREENEKKENRYFVVNREEFPRFNKAEEFFNWLKVKNNQNKFE